jgi:hypothetical protein
MILQNLPHLVIEAEASDSWFTLVLQRHFTHTNHLTVPDVAAFFQQRLSIILGNTVLCSLRQHHLDGLLSLSAMNQGEQDFFVGKSFHCFSNKKKIIPKA